VNVKFGNSERIEKFCSFNTHNMHYTGKDIIIIIISSSSSSSSSGSDRLCGLVVRVLGYRYGGPGSIPGTTRKKVMGLERGSLSLVSTTEELHT
jgi:hypothetical protein